MAIGDDAATAGMALVPGTLPANQLDTQDNQTRDYVANGTSFWKPGVRVPVSRGGHGAADAAGARSNLGITPQNILAIENSGAYWTKIGYNGTRLQWDVPGYVFPTLIPLMGDIPDTSGLVQKSGDTMSGNLFVPNASPATSSFTVAYINGDGRLSRGSSAERYKKFISQVDPASMGEVFPGLWRYQIRSVDGLGTDGHWRWGWIADRLAENPATEPFVVYGDDGQIESVDFIALLIVQTANLNMRVTALEQVTEGTE